MFWDVFWEGKSTALWRDFAQNLELVDQEHRPSEDDLKLLLDDEVSPEECKAIFALYPIVLNAVNLSRKPRWSAELSSPMLSSKKIRVSQGEHLVVG